jgi:hypothetical protein
VDYYRVDCLEYMYYVFGGIAQVCDSYEEGEGWGCGSDGVRAGDDEGADCTGSEGCGLDGKWGEGIISLRWGGKGIALAFAVSKDYYCVDGVLGARNRNFNIFLLCRLLLSMRANYVQSLDQKSKYLYPTPSQYMNPPYVHTHLPSYINQIPCRANSLALIHFNQACPEENHYPELS